MQDNTIRELERLELEQLARGGLAMIAEFDRQDLLGQMNDDAAGTGVTWTGVE